jgi:cysteine desulfurase
MIFLDYNSTTPVAEEVEAECSKLGDFWGNPGSIQHSHGERASNHLATSRNRISKAIGVDAIEFFFTGSATEAASLAIIGLVLGASPERPNVVVSSVEHKAVLAAAELAVKISGGSLRVLHVGRDGQILPGEASLKIDTTVSVVACMSANNETGIEMSPMSLREACSLAGAALVVDATQTVGKADLAKVQQCADSFFFSGHKIYGPRGVGGLVIKKSWQKDFVSIIPGGGQQRGIRGGTENVQAAAGLAVAVEKAVRDVELNKRRAQEAAAAFLGYLTEDGIVFSIVGADSPRLGNTLCLHFPGIDGDAILANLIQVKASTGSACNSANPEPSHVLLAMGLSFQESSSCVRFSFGIDHSEDQIRAAAAEVCQAVRRIGHLMEVVDYQ